MRQNLIGYVILGVIIGISILVTASYISGEVDKQKEQLEHGKEEQAYVLNSKGVVLPEGETVIPMVLDKNREVAKEGAIVRLLINKKSRYVRVGTDVEKELEGKEYIRVLDYLNGLVMVTEDKKEDEIVNSFKVDTGVVVGKHTRSRPKMTDKHYLDIYVFGSDFTVDVSMAEYNAYIETDKVRVVLTDSDELEIVN